jgi:hypothetical protein
MRVHDPKSMRGVCVLGGICDEPTEKAENISKHGLALLSVQLQYLPIEISIGGRHFRRRRRTGGYSRSHRSQISLMQVQSGPTSSSNGSIKPSIACSAAISPASTKLSRAEARARNTSRESTCDSVTVVTLLGTMSGRLPFVPPSRTAMRGSRPAAAGVALTASGASIDHAALSAPLADTTAGRRLSHRRKSSHKMMVRRPRLRAINSPDLIAS